MSAHLPQETINAALVAEKMKALGVRSEFDEVGTKYTNVNTEDLLGLLRRVEARLADSERLDWLMGQINRRSKWYREEAGVDRPTLDAARGVHPEGTATTRGAAVVAGETEMVDGVLRQKASVAGASPETSTDADMAFLRGFEDVAKGHMPMTTSFALVEQEDLTPREITAMAAALRDFVKTEQFRERSERPQSVSRVHTPAPTGCEWTPDEDGQYDTACGHKWYFDAGTATENNARFCVYCGKPLIDKGRTGWTGTVERAPAPTERVAIRTATGGEIVEATPSTDHCQPDGSDTPAHRVDGSE